MERIFGTSHTQQQVLEYLKIALLPSLSEIEKSQLEFILIEACNDSILSFWINEIDHYLTKVFYYLPESSDSQKSKVEFRYRLLEGIMDHSLAKE